MPAAIAQPRTVDQAQPAEGLSARRGVLGVRLLALALSLLLPVAALEFGFRAFGPFLPGEYKLGIAREFDPLLGWRNRPNFRGGGRGSEFAVHIAINQRGLRDEEIADQKPPGGFRVLMLGDSFVASEEVSLEQTAAKQLQGLLRATLAPRPVDVLNAGVSGYGTAQEYIYFDTEGYRYSPDVVLLVFFFGNDLINNSRDSDGRWDMPAFDLDDGGRLEQVAWPEKPPRSAQGLEEYLLRNSTAYNFLQSGVLGKVGRAANQIGEIGREPNQDFQIYQRGLSRKLIRSWEITETLFAEMARRSEQVGARLVVVGAPSWRMLDPDRFVALLREEGLNPARYDQDQPRRMLAEATARQNILYLDLLPALRHAAAGQDELYFPRNTHWTPVGQRVAAGTIHEFLVGRGLASSS